MTTEQNEPASSVQSAEPAKIDWFLQNVVDSVNKYGSEYAITLQVNGMFIAGTLIASPTYFEEFSELFAQGSSNPDHDRGQILDIAKKMREGLAAPVVPAPQFVHLRNAKFYDAAGNAIPHSDEGVLWRGRLTEVHGFFWGKLTRGAPQE
jgi:hypothetical protein